MEYRERNLGNGIKRNRKIINSVSYIQIEQSKYLSSSIHRILVSLSTRHPLWEQGIVLRMEAIIIQIVFSLFDQGEISLMQKWTVYLLINWFALQLHLSLTHCIDKFKYASIFSPRSFNSNSQGQYIFQTIVFSRKLIFFQKNLYNLLIRVPCFL